MYVIFTRSRLIAVIALVLLAVGIAGEISAAGNGTLDGKTNASRVGFAQSIGYSIEKSNPLSEKIIIPQSFSDVYEKYNELQKSAGFDLLPYCGCTVTKYTYIADAPSGYDGIFSMNILVYNGKIIGGDVSSSALSGVMLPLCKNPKN